MSILFHRRAEGGAAHQGLNWTWDKHSQPSVIILIWKLCIYVRRRPTALLAEQTPPKSRYVFSAEWTGFFLCGSLDYDWMYKRLQVGSKSITFEQLVDFIEKEGTLVNTSTPTR